MVAQRGTDFDDLKGEPSLSIALAAGRSYDKAAAEVGIGRRTVVRRMSDPDYRRRISEIRSGMLENASGQLANAATEAVTVLRVMLRTAESEHVRLGCARAILEQASRYREITELEQRLAALEAAVTEQSGELRRVK